MTTKTPAQGPRFLFNVGGTACGAGEMLAVQSIEETALEDFGSPDRAILRPDDQQGRQPKPTPSHSGGSLCLCWISLLPTMKTEEHTF